MTNTIFLPDAKRYESLVVLSVGSLLAQAIANTHSGQVGFESVRLGL